MQKKIIALAVAGLVSGAAFAQSNVTVYGAVDLSMNMMTGSANGSKNQTLMASGENHWTGIGFKGTEDLGNGLSATFDLLAQFDATNGANQADRLFARNATVGIASKSFGEVQFGRRQSFTDQLLGGFDASGRQTIHQASALMKSPGRYDNMVAYESARWNGFQVTLGGSTGIAGNVTPVENSTKYQADSSQRNLSAGANYMNGPLKVGFAYENTKRQSVTNTNAAVEGYDAQTQWTVAAGYDFGVVALSAEYGRINYSTDHIAEANATNQDYRTQWTVGAMIPLGAKDRIGLSYAHAKVDFVAPGVSADTANQYGFAYYHDLSKRTQVYAAYGHITQDSEGNAATSGLDPVNNDGRYRNGFQVGIAHTF